MGFRLQTMPWKWPRVRDRDDATVSTPVSSWLNFTPLSLNPQLWLDASDTSTITQSGGSVSQWNDKSGNGYHMLQASGTLQPKTGTRTQNNLNVLDFDGTDDFMAPGGLSSVWNFLHNGTKNIVAAVIKSDVTGSQRYILATSLSATGPGYELRYGTTTIDHIFRPSAVLTNQGGSTNTNSCILTVISDASNATAADRSFVFVNNQLPFSNNTGTTIASTGNAERVLHVGRRPDTASVYWDGWIAEIIIVSGTNAILSNANLLISYLNNKWRVF